MGNYEFNILGENFMFSQEKVNYVNLKWEYQNKYEIACKELDELLPNAKGKVGQYIQGFTDSIGNIFKNSIPVGAMIDTLKGNYDEYGFYFKFIEARNGYISQILALIKKITDEIVEELEQSKIYIDPEEILIFALNEMDLDDRLNECIEYTRRHCESVTSESAKEYIREMMRYAEMEMDDMSDIGGVKGAVWQNITLPIVKWGMTYINTKIFDDLHIATESGYDASTAQNIGNRIFTDAEARKAIIGAVSDLIFNCYKIKMNLFQSNGICSYEIIDSEDIAKAANLYKLYTTRALDEVNEKKAMAESLLLDPFQSVYYTVILDKYYDPNGELQKMAEIMGVPGLKERIENLLMEIFNNGDKSTLDSSTELRNKIIEMQDLFAYKESKAYFNATQRQYFLELSRKAKTLDRETILAEWNKIKAGNNEFVEDKGYYVPDDMCITALRRAFLLLKANTYIDRIKALELAYDKTVPDDTWVFFDNTIGYVSFEEKAFEVTKLEIERDENFNEQIYDADKLASEEVILGYYHFERLVNNGSPSMIITDKRIYTTKEKFVPLEKISNCKALKKLLMYYVIIERNDDNPDMQLPVSKELAENLANNINKLLCELSGREFQELSLERKDVGVALNTAKESAANAFGAAKKGFSKLFKK